VNRTSTKLKKRVAGQNDFESITALLKSVNLTIQGVKENLNNFIVLKYEDNLVGVGGFEIYGNKALLRSVAVEKGLQGTGLGKILVEEIISIARSKDIYEMYLLTETAPEFFKSLGFYEVSRDMVDEGIKSSEEFSSICPLTAVCLKMKTKPNRK